MSLIFYKEETKVSNFSHNIRESKDDVYINFEKPVPLLCNISVLVDTHTPVYCTIQEWDRLEKDPKNANNRVSCRFLDDEKFLKYVNYLINSHNKNCSPKEVVAAPRQRDVYIKIARSAFACSHEDPCDKNYVCCKKVMPRKYGCPISDEKGAYFYTTQDNNTPVENGLYILNSLIYINNISYRCTRGEGAKPIKGLNINGTFVAGAIMGRNNAEIFKTKAVTEEELAEHMKSFENFLKSTPNWNEGMEQEVEALSDDNQAHRTKSSKGVRVDESKIAKKRSMIQRSSDDEEDVGKSIKAKRSVSKKKPKVEEISSEEDDDVERIPKKASKTQDVRVVKTKSRNDVASKSRPSKPSPAPKKLVAKTIHKVNPTKLVDDSDTDGDDLATSIVENADSGSDSDVMY